MKNNIDVEFLTKICHTLFIFISPRLVFSALNLNINFILYIYYKANYVLLGCLLHWFGCFLYHIIQNDDLGNQLKFWVFSRIFRVLLYNNNIFSVKYFIYALILSNFQFNHLIPQFFNEFLFYNFVFCLVSSYPY